MSKKIYIMSLKKGIRFLMPDFMDGRLRTIKKLLFYLNPFALYRDRRERMQFEKNQSFPIPPLHLRTRIGAAREVAGFLEQGRRCYHDIEGILISHGKALNNFDSVLDFGCGCGRTLRHFRDWSSSKGKTIAGVDVDMEVINWCKSHLPFVSVQRSNIRPPLPFHAEKFDLIYAISVFTHLEEAFHFEWLSELDRVLRRDGCVIISVLGFYCYKFYTQGLNHESLPDDQHIPEFGHEASEFNKKGYIFSPIDIKSGYGTTFISPQYVYEHWSKYFKVIDIVPLGMARLQDVVILQKK